MRRGAPDRICTTARVRCFKLKLCELLALLHSLQTLVKNVRLHPSLLSVLSINECFCGALGATVDMNRLPITHSARVAARDAKLLEREERLAGERGEARMICKCRICIGSIRSRRKREHCRKHLRELGRHPYHRGFTRVSASRPAMAKFDTVAHIPFVAEFSSLVWRCLLIRVKGVRINTAST